MNEIKLIDEKTKLRNNLSEVIIAFKKCCNIIFDDSNISEFPVLNEFNNINKIVNHFHKICQLITNNSIKFENYSENTESIEEILNVLSQNVDIDDDTIYGNNFDNSINLIRFVRRLIRFGFYHKYVYITKYGGVIFAKREKITNYSFGRIR